MNDDLIERLQKRAEIRRQILTRKSVKEGRPDRIADLLEEAAARLAAAEAVIEAVRLADNNYCRVHEGYKPGENCSCGSIYRYFDMSIC